MQIRQQQLHQAVSRGLISGAQAEALWAMLAEDSQHTPTFRASHVLYYFGGLLAIGAMTLFMNLGWERFGGWGLFFLALFSAGAGLWLGERLSASVPMQRGGRADEVAAAIVWLLSDAASVCTGSVLDVSGGR